MLEMPQLVIVFDPALIIVANAVAGTPSCTERLLGKTAEKTTCSSWGETIVSAPARVEIPFGVVTVSRRGPTVAAGLTVIGIRISVLRTMILVPILMPPPLN